MTQRRALIATTGDRAYHVDVGADGHVSVTPAPADQGSSAPAIASTRGDQAPKSAQGPFTPLDAVVHYIGHGRTTVETGGRTRLAHVVDAGATRWVWIEGHVFEVAVEERTRARRRVRSSGTDRIAAPMPATVVTVPAREGLHVARGDTLVVLEAMKMELPLRAPHAGVVRAVHCAEGDLVQPGVTLVDLDPESASS